MPPRPPAALGFTEATSNRSGTALSACDCALVGMHRIKPIAGASTAVPSRPLVESSESIRALFLSASLLERMTIDQCAHAAEERSVLPQDSLGCCGVRFQAVVTSLVAATEQDAVVPREHIDVARSHSHVIHLGLRQQEG